MTEKIDMLDLSPYVRHVQTFLATDVNYYLPWRVIYDSEMLFVTDGECIVETENDKYKLTAGDIHIMKPFVRHKRYVEKGKSFNYYGVHYDLFYDKKNLDFSAHDVYQIPCWEMVEKTILDTNLAKRKIYEVDELPSRNALKVKRPSVFKQRFEELLTVFVSESATKQIRLRGIFLQILADLFDEVYTDGKAINTLNTEVVENYLKYIMTNFQEEINLSDITAEQGISPSHFRKLFKLITNKAPHEFLIDYRMEQAKKLLETGKYTVTEVSYMVGYDDYHYFSRLFKNKEGVSPKDFAK